MLTSRLASFMGVNRDSLSLYEHWSFSNRINLGFHGGQTSQTGFTLYAKRFMIKPKKVKSLN